MKFKLKHITIETCPTCNAEPDLERMDSRPDRTTSTAAETRRFWCGAVVEWNPIYHRELVGGRCRNSPEVRDELQQISATFEVILLVLSNRLREGQIRHDLARKFAQRLASEFALPLSEVASKPHPLLSRDDALPDHQLDDVLAGYYPRRGLAGEYRL